jgi:DNA-binding NtrC family response regulator
LPVDRGAGPLQNRSRPPALPSVVHLRLAAEPPPVPGRTLKLTGGRKGRAAALLRISRKALWKKIKRYGITQQHVKEED